MESKTKKKQNWRSLFFLLLGLNVVFLLIFLFILFWPLPSPNINISTHEGFESRAEFNIQSSKQDINQIVNDYLDEVMRGNNIQLSLNIDEDVHLFGSITAFGTDVPISIKMDPIVQENGDLVLKQNEMSLGLLNLPRDRMIHYIGAQMDAPDWLYFDSANEQIYIAVTEINRDGQFHMSVKDIDLSKDIIDFNINIQ